MSTKFKVIRGTEERISDYPYVDGHVYFAVDSGRIYMDAQGENKIPVGGGNGVIIHYGLIPADLEPESLNTYSVTYPDMFENKQTIPQIGDLILNKDGRFLRIESGGDGEYKCIVVSVSGGGGGGDGSSTNIGQAMSLTPERLTPSSTILNGQSVKFTITATAPKDTNGEDLDQEVYLSYEIYTSENGQPGTLYEKGNLPDIPSGGSITYDFGPLLRPSTASIIIFYGITGSMEKPKAVRRPITSSELRMEQAANFSNNNVFFANEEIILACNVIGSIDKILDFVYDGKVIHTEYLKPNATQEQKFSIKPTAANAELLTHGAHSVEFQVYQDIDPINHKRGEKDDVAPIKVEIAVVDRNNPKPVIWLGEYKSEYKTYDDIQIPYKVYNNGSNEAKVHFYKNNQEIEGSPYDIKITNQFEIFEISDAQENATNYYSISCGEQEMETRRDFDFVVVEDTEHDMTNPQKASLKLDFDARGRSNRESKAKRGKWVDAISGVSATFENFNWNNNGWTMDKGQTCLRISNGAKFKIPFGPMTFSGGGNTNTSNSIDIQFKIRNIQNYANLIKTVTRYKSDDNWYADYVAQGQKEYASYDSYLGAKLPALNKDGVMTSYDDLEFVGTEKFISLENLVCGYYDGDSSGVKGFCVGPQDAFFSNGANTVSADFVENQMVYLSFVYDGTKKNAEGKIMPMIYIYLNGILTGVVRTDISEPFTIGGEGKEIVFNSDVCDIDLYKLRFYNTALSVNDVVMNYAIDTKDITTYDQNGLAEYISTIQEYRLNFDKVKKYNDEHPRAPLMPYVIFDTSKSNNNDRLSFSKAYKVKIDMEFHNTPLEQAFKNGELEDLAIADGLLAKGETNAEKKAEAVRLYYKHHCPSFRAEASQLEVQGTSSQFYPRRNYKVKMKTELDDDKVERTHFWLMGGPYAALFEEHDTKRNIEEVKDKETGEVITPGYTNPCHTDWFYMDNYTVGTNRFTMKVDYMESSGTYNMGLANLVYNAYSKHPLEDYIKNNAFIMKDTNKTEDKDITDEVKAKLGSSVPDSNGNKIGLKWADYRTSVKGYPVMAFHKKSDGSIQFIGLYRMLLDKGSDECYGMKPHKEILHRLLGKEKTKVDETTGETIKYMSYPKLRDVVECWEFSDNNRGFCSFRDPWGREEFSFKAPTPEENPDAIRYTGTLAPIVADSFEYRYSQYEDALDVIYNIGGDSGEFSPLPLTKNDEGEYEDERTAALKDAFGDDFDVTDLEAIHEGLFKAMRNYEKVCAWIWATNMENVMSGGTYTEIELGDTPYKPKTYYVEVSENKFELDKGTEYDPTQTYFRKVTTSSGDSYEEVTIVDDAHTYKKKMFYIKSTLDENTYVLSEGEFDSAVTYYTFTTYSNEEIENIIENQPNVAKHTKKLTERYTAEKYPGYLTAEGYATWDLTKKYAYDTQEFRNEKFTNELAHHFDVEYLATYFVITEVLELYDSRGKNCMMASWGPKSAGGEYIWYPIFYDMDTQLGINNTGIPSFSYNVDATEEGNFSTSDSILWNNFYRAYKSSYILDKYKHLKGQEISAWGGTLNNAIFSEVAKVEAWYNADPNECKSIAMRGERPLVVKNLDEYYKYITITNNLGLHETDKTSGILNTTGYQFGEQGLYDFDDAGTYFYALQGDRSLSRQQFLTNRFEYIDSWLNQGNYQRGGANRIRGRVSANYKNNDTGKYYTSDCWTEDVDGYWKDGKEFTTKVNDFDSQYWLTLQPVRNTYVTLGGDANTTYPSQKYSGVPINYKVNEMEAAARNSNLAEKLLYVYGMNQMASAGDLYKNYWTEFYLEGELDKLSSLLLGCDGLMYDGDTIRQDAKGDTSINIDPVTGRITRASGTNELKAYKWFNDKINLPTMPSGGLPLLEEANFSNLQIQVTDPTLSLIKSEKLQDFRATGSNYTKIDFAPGAALHTLYLPKSVTRVDLQQTKMLTKIIEEYSFPRKIDGKYKAEPGLYIEQLTDLKEGQDSAVYYLRIDDDALGFDSYKLLEKYYRARQSKTSSQVQLTNVQWTPFTRLVEGDEFNEEIFEAGRYYLDDGHYGYTQIDKETYSVSKNFNKDLANGLLYVLDENYDEDTYMIKSYALLEELMAADSGFTNLDGTKAPNITGDVYICNSEDDAIDEDYIRSDFNTKYPELNITFKHVNKCYSMKFIIPDFTEDDKMEYLGTYKYAPLRNGSAEKSIQKSTSIDFTNPYVAYNPEASKANYDFIAWSSSPDVSKTDCYIGSAENITEDPQANADAWAEYIASIQPEEGVDAPLDYTIYALFKKHRYQVSFYNGTNNLVQTVSVTYGECLADHLPNLMYIHPEENQLDVYKAYRFLGFSRNDQNMVVSKASDAQLADYSRLFSVTDYRFYAVYMEVDVHETPTDLTLFEFEKDSYTDRSNSSYNVSAGYTIKPKDKSISGKITLPLTYQGPNDPAPLPIIGIAGFNNTGVTHVFWLGGDNPNLRIIRSSAFQATDIAFFEFTSKLREISQTAFYSRSKIVDKRCADLLAAAPLVYIGSEAFNSAFGFKNIEIFKLRGTIETIEAHAFLFQEGVNNTIGTLQIGSPDEPSVLTTCGNGDFPGIRPSDRAYDKYFTKGVVYGKSGVFNTNIIQDEKPHIICVGSWDVTMI